MTYEFNCTGNFRKELVKAIASITCEDVKYLGAPSFAYKVDYITIDRNGVLSFDDCADTEVIENLLEQLAEHGFTAELPETAPDSPDTAENSEVEEVPGDEEITEHGETVGLTVYLPKDKANIDLLRQLVQGKSGLIKKALGLKNLPIEEDSDEIAQALSQGHIAYVINTSDPSSSGVIRDGFEIRKYATENNVTMFTSLDTVRVLLDVLEETTLTISTIDA